MSAVTRPDERALEPKRLRRVLVGRPMRTHQAEDELLPIPLALPIFAADAISSVAYATEAAMVVLLGAGLTALHVALPISIAAAALLVDYVLTVAVSVASGGLAIASAAPSLSNYTTELSLAGVVVIMIVN